MTINQLRQASNSYPLFKLEDVFKWFPQVKRQTALNQINFWSKKGYLEKIRRGVYKIADYKIKDSFILANFIYSPSYISLETALNYHGIIPDIPFEITSVTINKTKVFKTQNYGTFSFHHLKPALFFGFYIIKGEKNYAYNMAFPEKALFDYLYLRAKTLESKEGFVEELRLFLPKEFNWTKFQKWSKLVSTKNKNFHQLVQILINKYGY